MRHSQDDIERHLHRISSKEPLPKNWHVLWVVKTFVGSGLFVRRGSVTDTAYDAFHSVKDAREQAKLSPMHRRHDALLVNAETGDTERVLSYLNEQEAKRVEQESKDEE